jgi:hypothetical protein
MESTTREIKIPHGDAKKLAESLGYSLPTVRKALRFCENRANICEAYRADKIRKAAKNGYNGKEVVITSQEE